MNVDQARAIVNTWFSGRKIDAIKDLRRISNGGLAESKEYLTENSKGGEEMLFVRLCTDYVQSAKDLLIRAREERRRLDLYIEQLEAETETGDIPLNVFEQDQPNPNQESR